MSCYLSSAGMPSSSHPTTARDPGLGVQHPNATVRDMHIGQIGGPPLTRRRSAAPSLQTPTYRRRPTFVASQGAVNSTPQYHMAAQERLQTGNMLWPEHDQRKEDISSRMGESGSKPREQRNSESAEGKLLGSAAELAPRPSHIQQIEPQQMPGQGAEQAILPGKLLVRSSSSYVRDD